MFWSSWWTPPFSNKNNHIVYFCCTEVAIQNGTSSYAINWWSLMRHSSFTNRHVHRGAMVENCASSLQNSSGLCARFQDLSTDTKGWTTKIHICWLIAGMANGFYLYRTCYKSKHPASYARGWLRGLRDKDSVQSTNWDEVGIPTEPPSRVAWRYHMNFWTTQHEYIIHV